MRTFGTRRWLASVALIALLNATYGGLHLRRPAIDDIGRTTLTAGEVMIDGGNPFASNIDQEAVRLMRSLGAGADAERYNGYKYLPIVAITYLPLGRPFGARGLIVSNFVLMGALLVGIWQLTRVMVSEDAARWAVLFFGTLPLPLFQVYAKGVTDILPVLPLVFSLALIARRPGVAGLLMGLSLSAKLIPAGLLLPLFLPAEADARKRYLVGAAIGLIPVLYYFALGPRVFVDNILIFNMVRPVDSTSWLAGHSQDFIRVMHVAFAAGWLATVATFVVRPPGLAARCGAATLAIIGALLIGPGMHENYMLWWLPFFAALVGRATIIGSAFEQLIPGRMGSPRMES